MSKPAQEGVVYCTAYTDWQKSITTLLDRAELPNRLAAERRVIIKPNLVEPLEPPITTPVGCIAALVSYIQKRAPNVDIVVAEGIGSKDHDTHDVFDFLDYTTWANDAKIELIDLNKESLVKLENENCRRWPEIYLPAIAFDSFLLSVPVLKAHTLAKVTLTMKNMMGLAPPSHYQQGGHWKKAAFHDNVQEAVFDLNRYRTPDFTLLDASVGMQEAHLWGPTCDPPHKKLVAGFDPVAVDSFGAALLGLDWQSIGHIQMANGVLGQADILEVVEVG